MHNEIYNGDNIVDGIDVLIQNQVNDRINVKWVMLDYFLTALYLTTYVIVVIRIINWLW